MGRERLQIGADLVGHVPLRGHAIGTDEAQIDLAVLHKMPAGIVGDDRVWHPLFAKLEVNGDDAHPLFKYLKAEAPGILGTQAIKWNFTKFLVDRNGKVVSRYAPRDKPEDLAADIDRLLG